MKTKGDIVNIALRKSGIASSSSLVQPTASMMGDYLEDLDNMMARWDGVLGIRIGYMFSDPDYGANTSDETGLPDWAINAVVMNLAVQILTDRSKPVKDSVAAQANEYLDNLQLRTYEVGSLNRRNDMPVGAGNKPQYYNRFYNEEAQDATLETSDGVTIIE